MLYALCLPRGRSVLTLAVGLSLSIRRTSSPGQSPTRDADSSLGSSIPHQRRHLPRLSVGLRAGPVAITWSTGGLEVTMHRRESERPIVALQSEHNASVVSQEAEFILTAEDVKASPRYQHRQPPAISSTQRRRLERSVRKAPSSRAKFRILVLQIAYSVSDMLEAAI